MKLTVKNIATLTIPKGKSEAIYFDDDVPGFGIRIREGGSKNWIFQYRLGKKQSRMSLGKVSAVSLINARRIASELYAKVKLGQDPAGQKAIDVQAVNDTVGNWVEQFLNANASKWRPNSRSQMERYLRKDAKPLHKLPLTSVSQRDIALWLNGFADRQVTGNRARSAVHSLFSWILQQGIILPGGNPVVNTVVHKEEARERVLTGDELKRIWNAAGDGNYGGIVRLVMLTGCRIREIGNLTYSEIGEGTIELPGARTKNGRPHSIPISSAIRSVLDKYRAPGRPFLFGRTSGFTDFGNAKVKLDARIGEIESWTLHDLRRTAATRMAELGVAPHVVEAVLNHVSGHKAGVAGIYNRATYANEKRAALELWGEHVMALVEGLNATVVPMRRA